MPTNILYTLWTVISIVTELITVVIKMYFFSVFNFITLYKEIELFVNTEIGLVTVRVNN
jgi:hypothetical protein